MIMEENNKTEGCFACLILILGYAGAALLLAFQCSDNGKEFDRTTRMVDRVEMIRRTDAHMDSVLREDSTYRALSSSGEEDDL